MGHVFTSADGGAVKQCANQNATQVQHAVWHKLSMPAFGEFSFSYNSLCFLKIELDA